MKCLTVKELAKKMERNRFFKNSLDDERCSSSRILQLADEKKTD